MKISSYGFLPLPISNGFTILARELLVKLYPSSLQTSQHRDNEESSFSLPENRTIIVMGIDSLCFPYPIDIKEWLSSQILPSSSIQNDYTTFISSIFEYFGEVESVRVLNHQKGLSMSMLLKPSHLLSSSFPFNTPTISSKTSKVFETKVDYNNISKNDISFSDLSSDNNLFSSIKPNPIVIIYKSTKSAEYLLSVALPFSKRQIQWKRQYLNFISNYNNIKNKDLKKKQKFIKDKPFENISDENNNTSSQIINDAPIKMLKSLNNDNYDNTTIQFFNAPYINFLNNNYNNTKQNNNISLSQTITNTIPLNFFLQNYLLRFLKPEILQKKVNNFMSNFDMIKDVEKQQKNHLKFNNIIDDDGFVTVKRSSTKSADGSFVMKSFNNNLKSIGRYMDGKKLFDGNLVLDEAKVAVLDAVEELKLKKKRKRKGGFENDFYRFQKKQILH